MLCFECNCDITPALFDRGGRVYYSCWMPFVGARAWMAHQLQVRGWHRITKKNKNKKFKGARTYCIINERDQPKNAIGSCIIDKNSKNFCASKNGTLTVSDCSTTCVPKSSRELSIWNGEKYWKRAAQLLIAPL